MRATNQFSIQTRPRLRAGWAGLALILFVFAAVPAWAANNLWITNVSLVNITPSSFSVVCATSPNAVPSISVFSDAAGTSSLGGTVGIELYPLHTGSPAATNLYSRRLGEAVLRQKTMSLGLVHLRVSDCLPRTIYYYRLQITNSLGQQAVWPASGPLPAVTTAQENSFVLQSRQIIINLPGLDPSGSVVILSNSNTPSLLAAVAGDGAAGNQVFFSVNDLLAAAANTNYLPLGNQSFQASILGASSNTFSQTYTLNFTTDFAVGQEIQFGLVDYAVLTLGSAISLAGSPTNVPIGLASSGVTNLTFVLTLPTNRISSVSAQAVSPVLTAASVQSTAANTYQVTLVVNPSQTLVASQQVAQLNFATYSNQSSTFVSLTPSSLQGGFADGSNSTQFAVQSGREVIVGNNPLLEALLSSGGARSVALYGVPGDTYEIQYSTNLVKTNGWINFVLIPMTNLMQVVSGLDQKPGQIFYRAYQFNADPPIVQASLANQNRSLIVYGQPGHNYVVQYATNLSGVVTWRPLLSYTLTNSFQFIPGIGNTSPVIFYRLQKP